MKGYFIVCWAPIVISLVITSFQMFLSCGAKISLSLQLYLILFQILCLYVTVDPKIKGRPILAKPDTPECKKCEMKSCGMLGRLESPNDVS